MSDRPPVPTSGKRIKLDIDNTLDATHVYIRKENPLGLQPRFEGPYPIWSRPSRSQVEVKVGLFKDDTPRLLTLNWETVKVANMRDGAPEGQRPPLGRKPGSVPLDSSNTTEAPEMASPADSVSEPDNELPLPNRLSDAELSENKQTTETAKIQTRNPRQTRNKNPRYVF